MKNENKISENLGVYGRFDSGFGKSCAKNLHREFVRLGKRKRLLTNELLALLPEIYESGVFKKYAGTIEEYAGRFGGLSASVVLKRLRLEKYVCDKPELRDAIRTEGVYKVALVASLATRENDWALADKVKNMSKPALQELSKELRSGLLANGANDRGVVGKDEETSVNQGLFENGLNMKVNDCGALKSVSCKAISTKITMEFDEEMSFMFLKLKKQIGDKLSNREIMKKILEIAEAHNDVKNANKNSAKNLLETNQLKALTDKKSIPGDNFGAGDGDENLEEKSDKIVQQNLKFQAVSKKSYIQVGLKREKLAETGGKCAYPGCNKPAENFHHAEPVSEGGSHGSIKPLCKIHHEFMHNGLVENQQMEAANWQLSLSGKMGYADYFYRHYRKS